MSLAAITEFRKEAGISSTLHRELLLADSWARDYEFANCINHENDSVHLEKFTSFAAWPVIKRAKGVVSQEYVPLGKVVRLRQHFEKFLQSEDALLRTWAQNIVEPDECCIYTTRTEGENEISEWIPCSPYLAPFSEESFRPRLTCRMYLNHRWQARFSAPLTPKRLNGLIVSIPLTEIGTDLEMVHP